MPYTPTERNRVGEFLMQGIAGAGQNIGAAIDRHKNEARKANALRKAISLYDEGMKDQVQSMGLGDLEGFITAQGMKQAKAAQESQSKFQAAQIRNFEADNARAAAQLKVQQDDQAMRQRQMEALAGFARDYGQPAVPGISLPSVLQAAGDPGERLRRALANNPGAMTPDLMQTLVRYGEEARPNRALEFQEDPVTGTRMATYGGSILPTGVNPEKQQLRPEAITAEDGTVLGYAVRNAKGALTVVKPQSITARDRLKVLQATAADLSAPPEDRAAAKAELEALMKSGSGQAKAPAKSGSLDDLWNKFQSSRNK